MKHSVIKIALIVLAAASFVGCKKKSDDGAAVSAGRDTRVSPNSGLPVGQGGIAGGQSAYIIVNPDQGPALQQAVRIFVSPMMDGNAVGDVDIRTGVEVKGNVGVSGSGVVSADSVIGVIIHDSYVGEKDGVQILPITVGVSNAAGTAQGNSANITFSDSYGTITLKGIYDAQNFKGTIEFQNNQGTYNGFKAGTLGTFNIPTCAFFRCM
jgi:hypothetical protein